MAFVQNQRRHGDLQHKRKAGELAAI
jgi:hypothetical protein